MSTIEKRKAEHLDICLKKDVSFKSKTTLFEDVSLEGVELVYHALPELDLKDISTKTFFLGKEFQAPFMASAITGGAKRSERINKDIATACQKLGLGMGLGSMRAMLEDEQLTYTYMVRDVAPDIFLAGNLGVAQLREHSIPEIRSALDAVGADALCIHVNAAQEIVQDEGDHDFREGMKRIRETATKLKMPVIVKEVGHGISREVARELSKTKIAAIDVEGAGGTSWVAVDSMRGRTGKELGEEFRDFGIPTAASILEVKSVFKKPVIAGGGIRNGLDSAKAICLGASMCAIALPILKAQARDGSLGVENVFTALTHSLKTAMFLTSSKNIKELGRANYTLSGRLREIAVQRKLA